MTARRQLHSHSLPRFRLSKDMTGPTYASIKRQSQPNQLVLEAVKLVCGGTRALDVGAGSLCDTRLLLSAGLDVDAVDIDRFAFECASQINHPKLQVFCADIRHLELAANVYSLIVAIHVLPFIPRDQLPAVCAKLVASLDVDGAICATFFGPRDEWALIRPRMSFVTSEEVASLFSHLSLIVCQESEYRGYDVHGNTKQWHVIRVIFRKARMTGPKCSYS